MNLTAHPEMIHGIVWLQHALLLF